MPGTNSFLIPNIECVYQLLRFQKWPNDMNVKLLDWWWWTDTGPWTQCANRNELSSSGGFIIKLRFTPNDLFRRVERRERNEGRRDLYVPVVERWTQSVQWEIPKVLNTNVIIIIVVIQYQRWIIQNVRKGEREWERENIENRCVRFRVSCGETTQRQQPPAPPSTSPKKNMYLFK